MQFTAINIDTFAGTIPAGSDLAVKEKADRQNKTAIVLYGFDEIGMFDGQFASPVYGFLKRGKKGN